MLIFLLREMEVKQFLIKIVNIQIIVRIYFIQ